VPFSLLDVLFFLIVLGIAITVHEWGHFIVARRMGVRVLRFSIGFGPPLLKIKRGETEYCIAPIPLGGYVKMAGESYDDELKGEPWEFLSASPWRRIPIVLAGPLMNLVLAAVIFFFILFLVGSEYTASHRLGIVIPGSLGDVAGLQVGDLLTEVNGEPVNRWDDVERGFNQGLVSDRAIRVEYEREGQSGEAVLPVETVVLGEGDPPIETLKAPPVLDMIDPVGPAWDLGLQRGDRILAIDGEPVEYWHEVYDRISQMVRRDESGAAQPVPFQLSWRTPQGEARSAEVTPILVKEGGKTLPKIGISAAQFGLIPAMEPVIGKVKSDSPAEAAGLKPGDRIVLINEQPIEHAFDLEETIHRSFERDSEGRPVGTPFELVWLTPEDETRAAMVTPKVTEMQYPSHLGFSSGRKIAFAEIGIQVRRDREKFGLLGASVKAIELTGNWCLRFFDLFKKLVTGEASVRLIGGPIAIAQGSAQQARWGGEEFFSWIAILSANLAIINLFPIPILDGGHILLYLIEIIRRKRLSVRAMEWAYRLAFFLFLLPLIVLIFYVDMDRLGWFDPIKRLFGP